MAALWTTPLRGHCHCNGCAYTLDPTRDIAASEMEPFLKEFGTNFVAFWDHCSDCRRATTSLAAGYFIIPLEYLVWSEGTEKYLKTYVSSKCDVERKFCGNCGTMFTYFRKSRRVGGSLDIIDITIPSLAEEFLNRLEELGMTPGIHMFWETGGIGWHKRQCIHGTKENGAKLFSDAYVRKESAVDVDAELAKLK